MLSKEQKEKLRTLTVEVVLEVRTAYLRSAQPNIMKHWTIIQDRMRSAATTTAGTDEWITSVMRALKLDAPSRPLTTAILELTHYVYELGADSDFLRMVENEFTMVMAIARNTVEKKKEASNEA